MKGNPLKQFYAFFFNYFWLPCPFPGCGRYFGGFESGQYSMPLNASGSYGLMTCKRHDHLENERRDAMISRMRREMGLPE